MAISKTQPMRPAEIALIDASNQHEQMLNTHTQRLNTLDAGLAAETSNREAADNALGVRIDNEAQARTAADNALGNRINIEIQARTAADNALGTRIDNETQARTNADTALGTRIDNEIQARADGDAALQGQIGEGFSTDLTIAQALSNEAQARTDADTALGTRIDNEAQARADGDAALQGQIGEGFSTNLTVAQSLSATNTAVSNIESEIGNGFNAQNTITAYAQALDLFLGTRTDLNDTVVNSILALASSSGALETFASRFKIGCINNVTIPANDSVSTSETFAEPFESTDACVLFAQVVTSELASLFTYTLIDCTYSGFSYSIANSDADAHTVSLGYVAVKVN